MIKTVSVALVSLLLYAILIIPFTSYLHNKPFVEKLGYVPSVRAFKSVAGDQKELVAASLIFKVLMYFGGIAEKAENQIAVAPDYMTMSRMLHGAVKLDPYNMDAYYFAQAFLTWDVKQYALANNLLDYGMRYRTWDWSLPFFAGFNSAYFLKDFSAAARYYQRAGELSGSDLSKMLAGRYMQKSGQTDLAIAYLTAMARGEKNQALKKTYLTRLKAFHEVHRIELACDQFSKKFGKLPSSIEQLLQERVLVTSPIDPYGGRFYLESDCKVSTTSKFAYAGAQKHKGKILENNLNDRH